MLILRVVKSENIYKIEEKQPRFFSNVKYLQYNYKHRFAEQPLVSFGLNSLENNGIGATK